MGTETRRMGLDELLDEMERRGYWPMSRKPYARQDGECAAYHFATKHGPLTLWSANEIREFLR